MVERICEAIHHVIGCNGRGETEDHIVPRCVGKILGWQEDKINSVENIRPLSGACHALADSNTRRIYYDLTVRLKKGEKVSEEEIINLFRRVKFIVD